MIYITETDEFQLSLPTVVTIGKFDGRHKGHQKLLRQLLLLKEQYGYQAAVFTFDTAPAALIAGTAQKLITTNQERRNNLEKMGIDYLVEYPFTPEVARLDPETFIRDFLVVGMNAKVIVVGTDCGFGYQRAGNAKLLQALAPVYGYKAVVVEKEREDCRDISSTYVKEELDRGNIEKANQLLGEPYAIHGRVVRGNRIGGSRLGFPTVNILPPEDKYLPLYGVYVSRVLAAGSYYGGVTNIGRKPTVGEDYPLGVETFILDLEAELYGEQIEVQLLHFIRPEQKFTSLDALKAQLEKDRQFAVDYFSSQSRASFPFGASTYSQ